LVQTLSDPEGKVGERFGYSTAIAANTQVIGALNIEKVLPVCCANGVEWVLEAPAKPEPALGSGIWRLGDGRRRHDRGGSAFGCYF